MHQFTHTVACTDRDFPEWHGGRSYAFVWAALLNDPELQQCITAARSRLGELLLPRYHRQPHVTVAFAGLAQEPDLPGYADPELAADLHALAPLALGPVEVRATVWESFPMVPYLGVSSDWLGNTHAALNTRVPKEWVTKYVPHVTVGHWAGRWPRQQALRQLYATVPSSAWQVNELSLLRYETRDIAGPLEPVGTFNLSTGAWGAVEVS